MHSAIGFVAGISAAALVTAGTASAGPLSGADEAVEVITTVTETTSKPFYNGSYYKIEVSAPDTCTLLKTVSDYSANGERTKTVVTTYDVSKIDPAKISADGLGGVKFWSYGEAPVFLMETTMGGDFSANIPGDSLSVRDEAAETGALLDALKFLAGHCAE